MCENFHLRKGAGQNSEPTEQSYFLASGWLKEWKKEHEKWNQLTRNILVVDSIYKKMTKNQKPLINPLIMYFDSKNKLIESGEKQAKQSGQKKLDTIVAPSINSKDPEYFWENLTQ